MALTDFAQLQPQEKVVWAREAFRVAREHSFIMRRMGQGPNSSIQRITDLTRTERGVKALIHLVHDLVEDGVAGDDTLQGRGEKMDASWTEIQVDQLSHATGNTGRMADQKSVIDARLEARDKLGYWLANRIDQLAFLTLAGIAYNYYPNGMPRPYNTFSRLGYAVDVTPPTTNRHVRWDAGTQSLQPGDTTQVDPADTPTWKMLLQLKAHAYTTFVPPLLGPGGMEYYEVYAHPNAIAALKQDADFLSAWRNAMPRSTENPLFRGTDVIYVDGLAIYEYRMSYNTTGAASGSKWGAAGDVDGNRMTLVGRQALGYAELNAPIWTEEQFDHGRRWEIGIAQMLGFKKPLFKTKHLPGEPVEDFSVVACDVAI